MKISNQCDLTILNIFWRLLETRFRQVLYSKKEETHTWEITLVSEMIPLLIFSSSCIATKEASVLFRTEIAYANTLNKMGWRFKKRVKFHASSKVKFCASKIKRSYQIRFTLMADIFFVLTIETILGRTRLHRPQASCSIDSNARFISQIIIL